MQQVTCSYSAAELHRRLLRLLDAPADRPTLEWFERTLGVPELHRFFDDPRAAWFSVFMQSVPGRDHAWQLIVEFRETFYPMLDTRPARFRGTKRPTLIDFKRRGEIWIRIGWVHPQSMTTQSPLCLSTDALVSAARRLGWRQEPSVPQPGSHGESFTYLHFEKGTIAASSDISDESPCVDDLVILRRPDSPEPAMTDEEKRKRGWLN